MLSHHSGFSIPINSKIVGAISPTPLLIFFNSLSTKIIGTGLVVCAVFGFRRVNHRFTVSVICNYNSGVIIGQCRCNHFSTHLSTASQACIAALIIPVWPTMSPLAKLRHTKSSPFQALELRHLLIQRHSFPAVNRR
jgi:hypothetical protein